MTLTTTTAPLAKISVAAENPRAGSKPVNVEALAANIARFGLRRPLFVYETAKGGYAAFAGSRRLAALQYLAKLANPDTPQAVKDLLAAVPIVVHPKQDIAALALADNESEPMTVAETVRAWSAMIDAGADMKEIANAFGVTEHRVKQRVALAKLHEPIFAALEANKIDMSIARLYANHTVERQAQVWKQVGGAKGYLWKVRDTLDKGRLSARDSIARFVGKDAYVAAGGVIEGDLFTDSGREEDANKPGETFWTNRALAEKLAQEKLDAEIEKATAAGWGFAVIKTDNWYSAYDYAQAPKSKGDQMKRDRAKLGLLISIDHNGKLATDVVAKKGASKGGKAAAKGAKSAKAGPGARPAPQPPMTNTTHELLTRTAGTIVGRAMAVNPQVAIGALIAHLARERWGDGKTSNRDDYSTSAILNVARNQDWRNEKNARHTAMRGDADFEAIDKAMREKVGDLSQIETTAAAWSDGARLLVLAFLLGDLVAVTENHVSINPKVRRARLAATGALMKIDPADHWAPDADFLMGYSRAELAKVAKELGVEEGKTKKATATAVAIAAADKRWVPPLMRQLTGAAADAKPAAAKASGQPLKGKTAAIMRKEAVKKSKVAGAKREVALT